MGNVLIVSNSLDFHADHVEGELRSTGNRVFRLNTNRMISDFSELIFDFSGNNEGLCLNGEWCSFSDIVSVWYRRPGVPENAGITDPHQRDFAAKELEELLRQLYFYLDDVFWVSPYMALEAARRKLPQLLVAKKCGILVPRTLVTNSPARIRSFFSKCGERVIYKTLHSPIISIEGYSEPWEVPTSILKPEHIQRLELIKNTGGIFQEYIEKTYEVRVTVIGHEIFSAKISSQECPDARIDWREGVSNGSVKVTPYRLPTEVADQCLAIVSHYGLNFGAIDLIRTPSGQYIFLEINCNGQWLWIEELTGQRLTASMAKLLSRS